MKWHNREKKLKQRHSQKDMGKPFKRISEKDSNIKKQLSKFRRRVKQEEQQVEVDDEMNNDDYQ